MKRLLPLLLLACGCQDATVRSMIIDNFVCVYMPWWMGDCQGSDVVAKVNGVLDHGIVAAQIDCSITIPNLSYRAQKLFDGSCLVTGTFAASRLIPVSDPDAVNCTIHSGGTQSESVSGGIVSYNAGSTDPSDDRHCSISTCCTGFNFQAFGAP